MERFVTVSNRLLDRVTSCLEREIQQSTRLLGG